MKPPDPAADLSSGTYQVDAEHRDSPTGPCVDEIAQDFEATVNISGDYVTLTLLGGAGLAIRFENIQGVLEVAPHDQLPLDFLRPGGGVETIEAVAFHVAADDELSGVVAWSRAYAGGDSCTGTTDWSVTK